MIGKLPLARILAAGLLFSACAGNVFTPDRNDQQTTLERTKRGKVIEVIWRVGLVSRDVFSGSFQNRSSPRATEDGRVVVVGTSDGGVSCLDTADGRLRWKFRTEGPCDVTMLLTENTVFFCGGDSNVHALRLADGSQLWKKQLARQSSAVPVLNGNQLLIQTDEDELVCLDAASGDWRWSYKHQQVLMERFRVAGSSSPLVVGGNIFASFSDGTLVKLSAKDGSPIAKLSLRDERDRFWDADVDLVMAGGLLIAGSFGQGLFAIDPNDLSVKWKVKVEGPSDVSMADGMLYFATADAEVIAVSTEDGKEVWRKKVEDGGLLSKPVVSGQWLLISSEELSLVAIDRASGDIIQVFNPGKGSSAAPGVFRDRAWWISNGETLYAMTVTR